MTDELDALASSRQRSIGATTAELLDALKLYIWLVRGLVIVAVGGALWYAHVEGKFTDYEKKFTEYDKLKEKREGQIATQEAYRISNDAVNAAQQFVAQKFSERLTKFETRLDIMEPHVTEMWFMKEHGISNRSDFYNRHGYQAPEGLGEQPVEPFKPK